MSILVLIVVLICLGILYAVGDMAIQRFFPEPPASMLRFGLIALICLAVVLLLLGMVGIGPGINLKIV